MFTKGKKHLHRYRQVAGVLAKHGWGWTLERFGLGEHIKKHSKLEPGQDAPIRVREMMEELGATFIKLGQILSTRPDLIPDAYIAELSKLQDNAPSIPAAEIRDVIESELGGSIGDFYSDFENVPVAAASLGQVHRAKLHDGKPVMIKVLRPGIREQVETDIEILFARAHSISQHYEPARSLGLMDLVDEFATTIREEMDYTREGRNTDRFREILAQEQSIHVPHVYWEHTTSRVLTLEEMQGLPINQVIATHPKGMDLKKVATVLASSFLKQIFVDGYFHADPHPGNLLVSETGEIALIDCGQTGRFDAEEKTSAMRMLMAFEHKDARMLADEILEIGITEQEIDVRSLTADLSKVLRSFHDVPSNSLNMGPLLVRVLHIAASHKIRLPAPFAVMAKVLTNVDGICLRLDPDFNFTDIAKKLVGRAVRSELKSDNAVADFYRALVALRSFLFNLPEHMERIMRKVVEGNLRVEFKHQGLEGLAQNFTNGTNRISIALIVSAMIVGSSLIVAVGKGSTGYFGLPTIGLTGYIMATVFGVWLVISILRSNKRR